MDTIPSQTQSIGLDAIFQYTSSGVQLFSGMVFYVVIARFFDTTAVGAIALFLAIIGLFNILFTFGLNTAAQHFTSFSLGSNEFFSVKRTTKKLLLYGFVLSFSGFVSLLLLAPEISIVFFHSISYDGTVKFLSLVLFGNIMYSILNGILLGIQNFKISALINIAIWITYYFGAILLAIFSRSIEVIIVGWGIGIFLGVFLELFVVLNSTYKHKDTGQVPSNTVLIAYSLPILISSVITYGAASADRFIVSGLLNLASLGIYNFSLLIASSISFIAIPFNNILMPKFSEMYARGLKEGIKTTAGVSVTLLSSLYIPVALGIASIAPMVLYLLGGNQYLSGVLSLRIIMFSTAIFIPQNILVQSVSAVKRTRLFLYPGIIALISNIGVSLILIPIYGLTGAALGFSSVYASSFLILYYLARKQNIIELDKVSIVKIWVASIIMFLVVTVASDIFGIYINYLPFYVGLGGIVYFSLARLLRVLRIDNKEFILSLFPQNAHKLKRIISFLLLN